MATPYLDTFLNYEKNLRKLSCRDLHLERVRLVLSKLGSPQNNLKVIHIAGSKGKGSTAAFIAQILKEAGYKVGLYTSPHLYDLRERFRILSPKSPLKFKSDIFNDCISEKRFFALIKKIRPHLEKGRHHPQYGSLTYFEVLTIAAFCYFKEEKVDFAVLETGLGGRLDATNVGPSLVAAITPISLEHTKQLGRILSKIASEKAGIIKDNCLAVTAPQKPEALRVIKARCRSVSVPLAIAKRTPLRTSLLGRHQKINAGTAVEIIEALRSLGFKISGQGVKKGLVQTFWPLRFEIFENIILDGAHNVDSCKRLVETVREVFPAKKVILIFGSSDDKDIEGMLRVLRPLAEEIILTSAAHPRAMTWDSKSVNRFFPKDKIFATESVETACKFASKVSGGKSLILVTGSLFVAAEARKSFNKLYE